MCRMSAVSATTHRSASGTTLTDMITAPYGSWQSPLTIDDLTAGNLRLGGGTVDRDIAYWTEAHAEQGGRTSIWCAAPGETPHELTPQHYVRTMVHEYGGGAWAVTDGVVVFSTYPSHQCFVLRDGDVRPLTPADGRLRYADFTILPAAGVVLAVREDHRASDLDCVNELVALRLDSDNSDGGTVLRTGCDFYAAPRVSASGTLAWLEWDHPNMPWDHTRLMLGRPSPTFDAVVDVQQIAGGDSAPCDPAWDGERLLFLDDSSGYWNFYAYADGTTTRLHDDDHDYCYPAWTFGGGTYVPLADDRIACLRCEDGHEQFGYLTGGRFAADSVRTSDVSIGGDADTLLLYASRPDQAPTLERIDVASGTRTELRRAFDAKLDADSLSLARSMTWESPDGPVQAWFYAPKNSGYTAPAGELPPLRVLVHGGPTGMTTDALRREVQFWTTQGWAILDVNYSGSAGFGRAYRERLQGNWGLSDVRDCADGAAETVRRGLVDPRRIAIEGGSAGGYTTLAALTSSDVFTAGNSLYGIADLNVFVHDTHKFESRYLLGLLGGTPDEVPDVFAERSPLNHLDRLRVPMLIQQGEDDRVVPPNQAVLMADAVRAKGLPVALLMFPGEGHGWRRAETMERSLHAALSFYGQVFGFTPHGVPALAIDNL